MIRLSAANLLRSLSLVPDRKRRTVLSDSWAASPAPTFGLFVVAILTGLGPGIARFSAARAVGLLPSAVEEGAMGSTLVIAAIGVGIGAVVSAVGGAFREAISAELVVSLTQGLQQRLMTDVMAPTGVEHLDSSSVRADLDSARGAMGSYWPAEAVGQLSRILSMRIDGVFAVLTLTWFEWRIGLLVALTWLVVKQAIRSNVLEAVRLIGGDSKGVERARYLEAVLTKPSAGKELRVFGVVDFFIDSFLGTWRTAMSETWRALGRLRLSALKFGALVCGAFAVAYWQTISAAFEEDISIAFALFLILSIPATSALGLLGESGVMIEFTLSAYPKRVKFQNSSHLLSEPIDALSNGTKPTTSSWKEIRFEGVSFSYGSRLVLDRIDLTLRRGESTAIVGVNGAGKSTIIALLLLARKPDSGVIYVDGVDLNSLDPTEWRSMFAGVFQDHLRLPFSLLENVTLGAPLRAEGEAALGRAGLHSLARSLESGFDTPLSHNAIGGAGLSGGQWQRLAIARMLFARNLGASIMVLDEPTAALDSEGDAAVYREVLALADGATTVLTSHRFSGVRLADTIHVIEGGVVVQSGNHEALVSQSGPYQDMFRVQASAFVDGKSL
jgi:ATP-binding cassette, subfamily B, bacterial